MIFLHFNQKNYTLAESNINAALLLARNISQIYRLYKALLLEGNIYKAQGKLEQAVKCYSEAETLAKKGKDKRRQYLALLKLVNCFDKMGLKEDWQSCAKKLFNLQEDMDLHHEEEILL